MFLCYHFLDVKNNIIPITIVNIEKPLKSMSRSSVPHTMPMMPVRAIGDQGTLRDSLPVAGLNFPDNVVYMEKKDERAKMRRYARRLVASS